MNSRFVVTGGPGAGKTTILTALSERGYSHKSESAREIIKERIASGMSPRPEPVSFAHEILRADIDKYLSIGTNNQLTFFDRGILDALYMLNAVNAISSEEVARYIRDYPYNNVVFLLPPWKQIYVNDSERDQTFEEAIEVFEGMKKWYLKWGYETLEVPKSNTTERISFILETTKGIVERQNLSDI